MLKYGIYYKMKMLDLNSNSKSYSKVFRNRRLLSKCSVI